jgi:cytoskeletal protein CcmA (bactofilin family)
MLLQTRSCLVLPVLCVLLVACGVGGDGDKPKNAVKRNGEDVLARGSEANVADSVAGDAILAGGDVHFSGSAGGDYLGAGGQQTIGGRIHGSLRAAGGEIHVTGSVDRNATIAGGNVELDSAAVVARNVYLVGGNVRVRGAVQGRLLATGGNVFLDGPVGSDVEVAAGGLHLGPRAQIAGNLVYRVPAAKVRIDPGARVSGTTTALPVRRGPGTFRVLWTLGFLVAGTVFVALLPRFAGEAADNLLVRPGRAALFGIGWLILVPIAIVIAFITIIGIPLGLLVMAMYAVLLYLGRVAVALWAGRLILGARARAGRQGLILNFLIGGLLLIILGVVPLVGGYLTLLATILGLGALVLSAQAMRERQPV